MPLRPTFWKIHSRILPPSRSRSSKWSLSLSSPRETPVCTSLVSHTCHIPCPSLHHPNNIWYGVRTIKFFIWQCSQLPCYVIAVRSRYLPQHPFLKTLNLCSMIHTKHISTLCGRKAGLLVLILVVHIITAQV